MCTSVSERVLLNVHSFVPSWENSIYSDNVQHHTSQVESELEIVVYADLID